MFFFSFLREQSRDNTLLVERDEVLRTPVLGLSLGARVGNGSECWLGLTGRVVDMWVSASREQKGVLTYGGNGNMLIRLMYQCCEEDPGILMFCFFAQSL